VPDQLLLSFAAGPAGPACGQSCGPARPFGGRADRALFVCQCCSLGFDRLGWPLRRDGPECPKCGRRTVVGAGSGPHYRKLKLSCPGCGHTWWLKRPRPGDLPHLMNI
jgi:hypothetical protein